MFLLCACETPSSEDIQTLPTPETFQKEGHNLKSFSWVNLYDGDGQPINILRGCLDDYDIKLRVTYDDDSTFDYDIKMYQLPRNVRDVLNTEGHHLVKILFRGQVVEGQFNIVPSGKKYQVEYYDNLGNLYKLYNVDPGEVITPPDPIEHPEDYYAFYTDNAWSVDLSGVDINADYRIDPQYTKNFKRSHFYNSKPTRYDTEHNILDVVHDTEHDLEYCYIHMGRFYHMPLYVANLEEVGDTVYHFDGTATETVTLTANFDGVINSYNQLLAQTMVQNVLNKDCYYDDTMTSATPRFINDDSAFLLRPMQFAVVDRTDKTISEILHGHTLTQFEDLPGNYELFDTHIGNYLDTHHDLDTLSVNYQIPVGSDVGYYRAIFESDVDVVLGLQSHKQVGGLSLEHVNCYFLIDPENTRTRLDYHPTSDDFLSTRKCNYTYDGVADDAYWAGGLLSWQRKRKLSLLVPPALLWLPRLRWEWPF